VAGEEVFWRVEYFTAWRQLLDPQAKLSTWR
jgi:hypothetical protein